MLRIPSQLLKSVKNWAFNHEHDVDFIQRVLNEHDALQKQSRMTKKLLIITGPQGSGNHLWSKILSETPGVQGWNKLTKQHWVGHGDEPWSPVWKDPTLFGKMKWSTNYQVTSISCPYLPNGGPVIDDESPAFVPNYDEFIAAAHDHGVEVKLAIIGRDMNILEYQQIRMRQQYTVPMFLQALDTLIKYDPVFISTELLYLYKKTYLQQLSKTLDFPISITDDKLDKILSINCNARYLHYAEMNELDELIINTPNGFDEKLL